MNAATARLPLSVSSAVAQPRSVEAPAPEERRNPRGLTARALNRYARLTGALLVAMAAVAIFAQFGMRQSMFIAGDAVATADAIRADPGMFRMGIAGYLVAFLLDVPVAVLLYLLMAETSRATALMSTSFRLVYTAVVGACLLPLVAAMVALDPAAVGATVSATQAEAWALFGLTLFDRGFLLSLVFFGLHLLGLGLVLWRSRQVPRWIGAFVAAGGVAYALDGVLVFVAPEARPATAPVVGVVAMSEMVLAFWLLLRGVRTQA